MDKAEAINRVKIYGRLVRQHMTVEHIYLFGSYAKNTYKTDSDIDVVVVVNRIEGDYFDINPLLWKLRRQVDDRIEPILIEQEFDDAGFLEEIKKQGIEL